MTTPTPPATAIDMRVALGPLLLKNPVVTASGTFGYGGEFEGFLDLGALGGIAVKGLTLEPRAGNPPPRVAETPAGMLNAIGLENVGCRAFIAEKLPHLRGLDTAVIANISGFTVDEYAQMAGMLAEADGVAAIEINVSCPNIKVGGIAFGSRPETIGEITRAVRGAAPTTPLLVKLSPHVSDIVAVARAAMEGGADALSITNTFLGLAIDAERRRPVLGNVTGGLSGPAIKPLALRLVWDVHRALPDVPICGMGGIMSGTDAVEFLLAGASAVAVGTASLITPTAAVDVLHGIETHCRRHGVNAVRELIGALEAPPA
jgi:dihydroorotate dehydrogenase (NAD+) catalytic subunit